MGTHESAIETRPKSRQVAGGIAVIAIGSFASLVAICFHGLVGLAGVGGAVLVFGIRGLARTNRFRWWQIALIVLATFIAAALLLAVAMVGLVLFAFRHYP
jgi:hypothetical protein